jgi:hypothetical protein
MKIVRSKMLVGRNKRWLTYKSRLLFYKEGRLYHMYNRMTTGTTAKGRAVIFLLLAVCIRLFCFAGNTYGFTYTWRTRNGEHIQCQQKCYYLHAAKISAVALLAKISTATMLHYNLWYKHTA